MNVDANNPRTLILVIPAKKHLFPMSTAALSMTQGSLKELDRDYRSAILLDEDGTVWQFDRVSIVGMYGTSAFQKFLSFLTRARNIEVTLSPRSMTLSDLKSLIVDCILRGRDFVNEGAEESERHQLASAVEAAPDAVAVVQAFKLPAPQDALDQL